MTGKGRSLAGWMRANLFSNPLSALATLAIFTFMNSWNDFFDPLIFLNRTEKFTLTVGLAFFNDEFATQYTKLMAGVVLSLIPMLAVYLFAQKYFTRGITLTGIRG